MGWADGWVAFDTETTGLGPSARILEIGVVTFQEGVPVREWSALLCPPDVDWGSEQVQGALAVNKLTREMLVGKPTFEQVLPDLLVELSHADVWVAHNAQFDMSMLTNELRRLGRPAIESPLLVCTRNLASHVGGGAGGNKLSQVAARFGVTQEDAHRAVVDARVCGLVLEAMRQRRLLPEGDVALGSLSRYAARNAARR